MRKGEDAAGFQAFHVAAARAAAIPWALSWFGGSAHGLVPDVLVSFQQSRNTGLWFFREVVQTELQVR